MSSDQVRSDTAQRPVSPHPPSTGRLLAAEVAVRAESYLALGRRAFSAAIHPLATARTAFELAGAFGTVAPPAGFARDISINKPIGAKRRLIFQRHPLGELQSVGAESGATINELVLTAVAAGIRALLVSRDCTVAGASVHIGVPVSIHSQAGHSGGGGPAAGLGNAVSARIVAIPLDHELPASALSATVRAYRHSVATHQSSMTNALVSAAEFVPAPAISMVAKLHGRQPLINMIVTNVPGPSFPLYALGAEMIEVLPVVPLGGNLDIGIAVFSYRDCLGVGIVADPELVPDIDIFANALDGMFRQLVDLYRPRASAGREVHTEPQSGTRSSNQEETKTRRARAS